MRNPFKYTGDDMMSAFILGLAIPTFLIVLGILALRGL